LLYLVSYAASIEPQFIFVVGCLQQKANLQKGEHFGAIAPRIAQATDVSGIHPPPVPLGSPVYPGILLPA